MKQEYSVVEMLAFLRRRWLIVSLTVMISIGMGIIAVLFFITPQYRVSSQFIVTDSESPNRDTQVFTSESIRSNIELINTYNVIIKSPAILEKVGERAGVDLSVEELEQKISVTSSEESQVVDVTVTDADPALAAATANTTVLAFKESVPELMNVNNVSVLSEAKVTSNMTPATPGPLIVLMIFAAGGAVAGGGAALLRESYDTKIVIENDIVETLGVPFLGEVSFISDKHVPSREFWPSKTAKPALMRKKSTGS